LPEELTAFDNLNNIYLDDFGCRIVLGVYYLPQRDYDRLEDVMYGDIYINRDHMKGANE
jgi:small nuclear ribonucleoprotein (snRNP)-like protein